MTTELSWGGFLHLQIRNQDAMTYYDESENPMSKAARRSSGKGKAPVTSSSAPSGRRRSTVVSKLDDEPCSRTSRSSKIFPGVEIRNSLGAERRKLHASFLAGQLKPVSPPPKAIAWHNDRLKLCFGLAVNGIVASGLAVLGGLCLWQSCEMLHWCLTPSFSISLCGSNGGVDA